ncbi:MAG: hypothetical protein CM1200mP8_4790 [Chloroflexota bacterium]|nr:MAG: hypothetical protein CM1200mP8_4790 [Chloroflexota bacterium]
MQVLTPWEKWDGSDYEKIPLLVKTQGKTTTDHISPAGTGSDIEDTLKSSVRTCLWVLSMLLLVTPVQQ